MIAHRFPRLVRYLPFAAIAVGAVAFMPADQDAASVTGSAESAINTATASQASEPVAAAPQPAALLRAERRAPRLAEIATVDVSPRPFVPTIATPEPVEQADTAPAPWVDAETLLAAAASLPAGGLPLQPAAESGAERLAELGRVGSSAVNVRAGPSTSTAVLFVLRPGEEVRVAEAERGWVRVEADSGASGWVYGRYVSTARAAAEPAAQPRRPAASEATAVASARSTEPEPRRTVTSTVVDQGNAAARHARLDSDMALRAGPFSNAPRLLVLGAGERVAIAETRGAWMRVRTANGVSGWVRYR